MSIDVREFRGIQSSGLAVRVALHVSNLLDVWSERRRQRRALLEFSDHMLKDIGRADAYREGRKPFWCR